jgi:hypothetical protein
MFETPALDMQELRSVLTDAGHTVVGLATMAAKKANDVRLDMSDRYEEQTADLRSNLLTVVEKFADVRTKVEARVEPVIESFTDRLPAPARKVVETMTESVKDAQDKAHRMVVDALTVEVPVAKPATKTAAKPATPKTAARKTAKTTAAKKIAVKKPVAKTSTAKTSTAKAAATKAPAKKAARKAA